MIIERFRAELDDLAEYLALAERRGDGVQVVLTWEAGKGAKGAKATAYAEPLTNKTHRP